MKDTRLTWLIDLYVASQSEFEHMFKKDDMICDLMDKVNKYAKREINAIKKAQYSGIDIKRAQRSDNSFYYLSIGTCVSRGD